MIKIISKIFRLTIVILGGIFIYLYIAQNDIVDIALNYYKSEHTVIVNNNYANNYSDSSKNNFVKITEDFVPNNRQDLLNIFYTVLFSGTNEFTFYCDKGYAGCVSDIKNIMNDNSLLSNLNNFVQSYNSYKSIRTTYTNAGKVSIKIDKLYSDDVIKLLNDKIDELYRALVSNIKSKRENIKSIHDYIISTTKYDTDYAQMAENKANTAYGPLFQGYAICSGYTDLMSLFLDKMGITNHKVANDNHVWNLVYLDGTWLHLDLTWDDPTTNDGKDYLNYDYFLINTEKLKEQDKNKNTLAHSFNESIYLH